MLGKLEVEGGEKISSYTDPNKRNLVSEVSITEPRVFGKGNAVKVRASRLFRFGYYSSAGKIGGISASRCVGCCACCSVRRASLHASAA